MAEQETAQAEQKEQPTTFTQEQVNEMIEKATGGLKSKVDELLGEKKSAAQKARDAEAEAQRIAEEAARKAGDTEALEKSWQAKLAKVEEASSGKLSAYEKTIQNLTVGREAATLAGELAVQGSASVLERIVRDRLSVEMTDEGPKVRVLDASGKPSAASIADLKAELAADAGLAPLIAGSKASGGGAAGANGGAGNRKTVKRSEWDGMNHVQRADFSKSGGKVVND